MARKFLRRFLPDHHTIREHRHIRRFGPWLQHPNLWHLNRKSVAGGVAAGLFAGLVPGSNPVQFLVATLLAIGFRVNLPIAVVVTLYSNPFTIVPLYYVAFRLGEIVLRENGGGLPSMTGVFEGRPWQEWLPVALDWLVNVGKPLLVGIPLLATALAVVGYFVADWAWRGYVAHAWRCRRRRRPS